MKHIKVDKIFCINLEKRPEKWEAVQVEFGYHNLNVARVMGVDGNDFKKEYPCSPGNNGCTLSHYWCILQAKMLGLKSIMIFEDDVELHEDFRNILDAALTEAPKDWELIYLGGTHREPPVQVTEHLYRVSRTLCVHAYIIHERFYNYALNNMPSLCQPCDCYYSDMQSFGNMYVINPPIAWQQCGHSDIVGRNMDYPWLREPLK